MKHLIDNEEYRKIHFAVMAIESGAEKLNISGRDMENRVTTKGQAMKIEQALDQLKYKNPNNQICIRNQEIIDKNAANSCKLAASLFLNPKKSFTAIYSAHHP